MQCSVGAARSSRLRCLQASSSIEATRDTASASLADVATGAAELDQLRSSTSAAASTGDGDESLQEEVVATGAGVENGNGAGEDCDWSGSSVCPHLFFPAYLCPDKSDVLGWVDKPWCQMRQQILTYGALISVLCRGHTRAGTSV